MELEKGEFRVYFNIKNMRETKRRELETKVEELLKSFGYSQWASGINTVSRVRDLAFDKGIPRKNPTEFTETKHRITAIVRDINEAGRNLARVR